jgi:hypothetical protein
MLFDSGLPIYRLIGGVREHLRADLLRAQAAGAIRVADIVVVESVYVGAHLGSCLDVYRKRLDVSDIAAVVSQLLTLLGVDDDTARHLSGLPQEFAPWRPLPLSSLGED